MKDVAQEPEQRECCYLGAGDADEARARHAGVHEHACAYAEPELRREAEDWVDVQGLLVEVRHVHDARHSRGEDYGGGYRGFPVCVVDGFSNHCLFQLARHAIPAGSGLKATDWLIIGCLSVVKCERLAQSGIICILVWATDLLGMLTYVAAGR